MPAAITIDEAAKQLHVARQTVYNLINRGVLNKYKIGAATRLNAREVFALVGENDHVEAA